MLPMVCYIPGIRVGPSAPLVEGPQFWRVRIDSCVVLVGVVVGDRSVLRDVNPEERIEKAGLLLYA